MDCVLRQIEGENDEERLVNYKDQGDEEDYNNQDDYDDHDRTIITAMTTMMTEIHTTNLRITRISKRS